jgi:cell wall-associated NlpC family hydrolase
MLKKDVPVASARLAVLRSKPCRHQVLSLILAGMVILSPTAWAGPTAAKTANANANAPQSAPAPSSVWRGAQDLAIYALSMIGVDYRYGGTTPDRGLDCSGLVRYVFQQVTGVTLPRTSQELSRLGTKVSAADLMPGDLVFFNTRRLQYSHVGIYLGEDRFIHAPRQGGEVEIVAFSKDYWHKRFDGARRLVGAIPDLIPSAQAEPGAAGSTSSRADAESAAADTGESNASSPEKLLP